MIYTRIFMIPIDSGVHFTPKIIPFTEILLLKIISYYNFATGFLWNIQLII
jgi:hypothetical protein